MSQDFKEFFELLNSKRIDYLVIGGVAFNFHARPRATKDIDLWVRPDRESLTRLIAAIAEFGFPVDGLDLDDLAANQRVLMLGRPPHRIDILTRPSGVVWEPCWEARVASDYSGAPVHYLSLDHLIAAKRAAGRPRDLADVAELERVRASGRGPG